MLFPAALGEDIISLYCMASQLQIRDSIRTLIAFLNNFTYTQTKTITWQTSHLPRGVPEVYDIVLPHMVVDNNKTIQPDWLKTTLTEVAHGVKYIWKMTSKIWIFFSYNFAQVWKGGQQWLKGRWLTAGWHEKCFAVDHKAGSRESPHRFLHLTW